MNQFNENPDQSWAYSYTITASYIPATPPYHGRLPSESQLVVEKDSQWTGTVRGITVLRNFRAQCTGAKV